MSAFKQALANNQEAVTTENGMKAFDTTTSACLDLFYAIGASRGQDITTIFAKAYAENMELAVRILLWARDVRHGAGERQTFRNIALFMEQHPAIFQHYLELIIKNTAEFGRFDDLLVYQTDTNKALAYAEFKKAIDSGNGLAAKWAPRENKRSAEKNRIAHELATFFGLSPRSYRKLIVKLSKTVETQMCAKEWSGVEYSHVPSVASARYASAFKRHDTERYTQFVEDAKSGKTKINASAVFPHDVLRNANAGTQDTVLAQWNALPNYMSDEGRILPMVDVSGSMQSVSVGGSLTALDVAVALGLYISDKNKGDLKDVFMTFSGTPAIKTLHGDILKKKLQLERSDWGMNTDLAKAFEALLSFGTKHGLTNDEMPTHILILSDMEFDDATGGDRGGYYSRSSRHSADAWNPSALQMIRQKYEAKGYEVPKIVFWNLNDRNQHVPAAKSDTNVALVSGFNTNILKSVLKSEKYDPITVMLETVMTERYNIFS